MVEFILCTGLKYIMCLCCVYVCICTFRPVAQLIIEHVISMDATSKTGIKHKTLPIQERLEV